MITAKTGLSGRGPVPETPDGAEVKGCTVGAVLGRMLPTPGVQEVWNPPFRSHYPPPRRPFEHKLHPMPDVADRKLSAPPPSDCTVDAQVIERISVRRADAPCLGAKGGRPAADPCLVPGLSDGSSTSDVVDAFPIPLHPPREAMRHCLPPQHSLTAPVTNGSPGQLLRIGLDLL
ncbi:MAG: hypothetical protein M1826_004040 [Phylliscum demangeonii]|nr:MAG: hypothetical protein M1826_004040 [Phylliscum demangeonii]